MIEIFLRPGMDRFEPMHWLIDRPEFQDGQVKMEGERVIWVCRVKRAEEFSLAA